jgi:membrane protein DedA with SNARE-associated domain
MKLPSFIGAGYNTKIMHLIWTWISNQAYVILFVGVLFEGAFSTAGGAFAAALGSLDARMVLLISVLGNLIPDFFFYALGWFGRQKVLNRYERFFHVSGKKIQKMERLFLAHPGKTLFVAKIVPALAIPALIGAGVIKMPLRKFAPLCLLITMLGSSLYFAIGYYFGAAYTKIVHYIDYGGYVLIGAVLLGALGIYGSKRLSARLAQKIEDI